MLGTTDDLPHILRDNPPDEVLIAIPSASGETRQQVVEIAQDAGVPVKTLPGLYELISGDLNLAGQIRPVQVEDVLGREPVEVDVGSIAKYLAGETVLVTGAGGSIGAELCRQIARVGPAPARARRPCRRRRSSTSSASSSASATSRRSRRFSATVGDRAKMRQVFERYKPGVVFHAAAYKHVALLEANPLEAVRNNTLATRVIADVAVEYGAQTVRARLDRQGREPEEPARPVEGALRVDRRGVRTPRRHRARASSPFASATSSAPRAA